MSVPISILTGFLGSGKTTLLRHLLTEGLGGRRVAVIVNEFGEVGLDGRVVEGLNVERMIELSSGCVCCTMSAEFVLAVEEIVAFVEPELIIIETTGLADPGSLIGQVRGADYRLDSVVTVVDAANLQATLGLAEVVRWQIEAADFLVLNKLDLVDAVVLGEARQQLRALNGRAVVFETTQGLLDGEALFAPALRPALLGERGIVRHGGQGHLAADGFGSFALTADEPLDRKRFEALLSSLPQSVYRAKGFVHCTDATWPTMFQHVAGRLEYEWTRFKHEPAHLVEAVFIGQNVDALRETIAAQLRDCVADAEARRRWREIQALRLAG